MENGLTVTSVSAGNCEEIQGINTRNDLSCLMATLWKWKNEELMRKGVTIEDPASSFIDMDVIVDTFLEYGHGVFGTPARTPAMRYDVWRVVGPRGQAGAHCDQQ